MQKARETASNVAASATSGLDKTKAVAQEKVEKMTAHDPVEKEVATERKQDKINKAELDKQMAYAHNAASADETGAGTYTHSATGSPDQPTGGQQKAALPGHGTGEPAGRIEEGVVKSHPIGISAGTRHTAGDNLQVGSSGDPNTGYGTEGQSHPVEWGSQ